MCCRAPQESFETSVAILTFRHKQNHRGGLEAMRAVMSPVCTRCLFGDHYRACTSTDDLRA